MKENFGVFYVFGVFLSFGMFWALFLPTQPIAFFVMFWASMLWPFTWTTYIGYNLIFLVSAWLTVFAS